MIAPQCKDCRFSRWTWRDRLIFPTAAMRQKYQKCAHPVVGSYHWMTTPERYCDIEREPFYGSINACGPNGKLFEPRPVRWWQWWRK